MAKKYTVLETWIVNECKPEESTSAEQTFGRMTQQSGGKLPVIDVPLDFRDENHVMDEARVRDFVSALPNAEKVLGVGCGDGWPVLRIAPFFQSVVGVDASQRRLDVTTANAARLGLGNVALKCQSQTKLEFKDASFDGAVAAYSIEQATDPYAALREVFRVLKPGGRFRILFESYDQRDKGVAERVFVTENEDCLGFHYVLTHNPPPWERNYLVKFNTAPETKEAFKKLADLIERIGPNPALNPEVGIQFLEQNRAAITGSSWYELEHFTSETMKQTLEEMGFVGVRVCYSAATLAKTLWPRVKESGLSESQVRDLLAGLADVAVRFEAPLGSGEPVSAVKPS